MPLLRLRVVPQALLLACLLMMASSAAFATAVPGANAPVRLWNSGTCPYAQVGMCVREMIVRVELNN